MASTMYERCFGCPRLSLPPKACKSIEPEKPVCTTFRACQILSSSRRSTVPLIPRPTSHYENAVPFVTSKKCCTVRVPCRWRLAVAAYVVDPRQRRQIKQVEGARDRPVRVTPECENIA